MKSIIAAFALACLLTGCESTDTTPQPQSTPSASMGGGSHNPLTIARAYIDKERPDWERALRLNPRVMDQGNTWQVTFEPGGSPVITIDKKTGKVLDAFSQ